MSITSVINVYGALTAVGVAAYCLYAVLSGFRSARRENEQQREILRREIQRETRELIHLQNGKIEALERELADTRRQLVATRRQLTEARKTEIALRDRIRELETQVQTLTHRMNNGSTPPHKKGTA